MLKDLNDLQMFLNTIKTPFVFEAQGAKKIALKRLGVIFRCCKWLHVGVLEICMSFLHS